MYNLRVLVGELSRLREQTQLSDMSVITRALDKVKIAPTSIDSLASAAPSFVFLSIARDLEGNSGQVQALTDTVSRLESRLLQLEDTIPVGPAPGCMGSYITNLETRRLHFTLASPAWPAQLQRTKGCGWPFMMHRFERAHLRPGGFSWKQICSRCLPEYRAECRAIVQDVVVDSD